MTFSWPSGPFDPFEPEKKYSKGFVSIIVRQMSVENMPSMLESILGWWLWASICLLYWSFTQDGEWVVPMRETGWEYMDASSPLRLSAKLSCACTKLSFFRSLLVCLNRVSPIPTCPYLYCYVCFWCACVCVCVFVCSSSVPSPPFVYHILSPR